MEKKFIQSYLEWIKKNVFVSKIGDNKWLIETPFLDRHNDYIEIYIIKKENDKYLLTDDSYVYSDLKASGFELSSPKRKELFNLALIGLGVHFNERTKELYLETDITHIGKNKHNLMQAMVTISDMFMLAGPTVSVLFKEDVRRYFRRKEVPFVYDIKVVGMSTFEHNIEIALPTIRDRPETFIKLINNPIKNYAELAIFTLNDIKAIRKAVIGTVIYNDSEKVSKGFVEALKAYKIEAVPWSKRDDYVDALHLNKGFI